MFGPFVTIPDQRAIWTSCIGSFSVIWVPKLLLTSARNWILWPKNSQIWPKTAFFGQISAFFVHLVLCPTKKQCKQGAQVVCLLCGYQNFCFLPLKLGILAKNRPNLAQKWHFWPISSQELAKYAFLGTFLASSFGALLVGGCGAGCISQDTYLLNGISGVNTKLLFCRTLPA